MSSMEPAWRAELASSSRERDSGYDFVGAAPVSAHARLARQWQMLAAISRTRHGLSLSELKASVGISKATVHRYLRFMTDAGLPIAQEEGRYRLLTERELPPAGFSALQLASLQLARMQLDALQGAPVVVELDRLIEALNQPPAQQIFRFAPSRKPSPEPEIVKTIERAHRYRKRATIEYRAASRGGALTTVQIEPLFVNVADGDPYVRAYCVERQQERTYKLSRISKATLTSLAATHRAESGTPAAFEHSVKAWSGDLHRVRIRIDADVAWLAREYPLPGQIEAKQGDGSVIIDATVSGLVEARRRILAWGSSVEVLDPPPLRKAVRDELAAALRRYDGPGPARTSGAADQKSTRAPKRVSHGS